MTKEYNINQDNAREMQRKGVEKRKENTAKRRAMREILMDELSKPVTEGSKMTKLEWLIAKAISNTKDEVGLSDLQRLQELLGEKQMNYNFSVNKNSEQILKDVFGDEG